MFLLISILQVFSIAAKQVTVFSNEQNLIDTFPDYGIILDANITYITPNAEICDVIKQQLIHYQSNQFHLNSDIKEGTFKEKYFNGSQIEQINQEYITSMVPIPTGVVILFNSGLLTYFEENQENQFIMKSNYTISIDKIQLKYPMYTFYFAKTQQLLIVLYKQIIKVSIKINEANIFGSNINTTDIRFLTTQNIQLVEDFLFIAGNQDLNIYDVQQDVFENFTNSQSPQNFIDIKVMFENGFYKVFSLHRQLGVTIYTYSPTLKQFIRNVSFNKIQQKGYMMGLYQNVVMIIDDLENESLVYEFHYSQIKNTYNLFQIVKAQKNIKDIEFNEHYAILIGSNGHELIYHSLPSVNYQIKSNVVIPGLQQIYLLNNTGTYNQSLIGITKHTFFTSYFYLSPQKIRCQYKHDLNSINFIYYQNSTQCSELPNKEESRLCFLTTNYTVNYIHPVITTEYSIYIWIIGLFIFIALAIPFGFTIFYFQRYKYLITQANQQNQKNQQIPSNIQSTKNSDSIGSHFHSQLATPSNDKKSLINEDKDSINSSKSPSQFQKINQSQDGTTYFESSNKVMELTTLNISNNKSMIQKDLSLA